MNMDTNMSGSTVKNHISLNMVFEYSVLCKTSYQSWFLVYLQLPQARLLQNPTTHSCQEIDHHPAIEPSESVDRQALRNPYTSETPEELLHEPTEIQKTK